MSIFSTHPKMRDMERVQRSYRSSMLRHSSWCNMNLAVHFTECKFLSFCDKEVSRHMVSHNLRYWDACPWVAGFDYDDVLVVSHFGCGLATKDYRQATPWHREYDNDLQRDVIMADWGPYEEDNFLTYPINMRAGVRFFRALAQYQDGIIFAVPEYLGKMLRKSGFLDLQLQVPQYFAGEVITKNIFVNHMDNAVKAALFMLAAEY